MALDLLVVPVSTLEALARAAARHDVLVAPWMDAQRGEVFAAVYTEGAEMLVLEPTSLPPLATLRAWIEVLPHQSIRFIGDGAVRHAPVIRDQLGTRAEIVAEVPALARVIARIAADAPERAVRPHAIVPTYIRRPDAELARARRRINSD
jgi:tRNA threonylcarbamoyladenosine biosynthesis protein TsaB